MGIVSNLHAEVAIERDVPYGTGGGHPLLLDITRPATTTVTNLLPAVIFVHGGGWRGGDRTNAPTRLLAEKGYFTASISYRLSGEAKFPAAVEDCKCAVRWLRANAVKYHVDPNRIGIWGPSAGGHLVEFLGVTADDPRFEGAGGWSNVSSRVACVVSYCGPSDLMPRPAVETPPILIEVINQFLGATPEEKTDLYRQASPITYVSKNTAPMLLVHGDQDKIVPVEQSHWMMAALQAAGVEHRLIVVHNGGHHFQSENTISPDRDEINQAVIDWFEKYLRSESVRSSEVPRR